jgi:hypothetical protein
MPFINATQIYVPKAFILVFRHPLPMICAQRQQSIAGRGVCGNAGNKTAGI